MTTIDKFKQLATDIGQLSGHPYDHAWNKAQDWKGQAKELFSDVFSDVPDARDRLLGRLGNVFVSSPSCAVDGEFISSSSGEDAQRDFERDIKMAQDIMCDTCREFERLSAKYR